MLTYLLPSLSLSLECSGLSGRSRAPMTPVFSVIISFLYMFIFHVVALHPVYYRSILSPTSSCHFHSAFFLDMQAYIVCKLEHHCNINIIIIITEIYNVLTYLQIAVV